MEKLKIVSEKGAKKHRKLNSQVEQLIISAGKEKNLADNAEEYTYIQRLLVNRAKKPADDFRVEITALQREIEATENLNLINENNKSPYSSEILSDFNRTSSFNSSSSS